MIARAAERYEAEHLGIGSDLCQNQPDSVIAWMRNGHWSSRSRGYATRNAFGRWRLR
jgi:hypothetical protein